MTATLLHCFVIGRIMRVEFCETVDVTGTAHVTVEDIAAALVESLSESQNEKESERWRETSLKSLVNSVHQVLSAVSDEMIATIPEDQQGMIYRGLLAQVERWNSSR